MTTWSLLYLLIWSIPTSISFSNSKYPSSAATATIFSILLPDTATFLPCILAASIICCILWTLDANVATITLPFAFEKSLAKLSPTTLSDKVYPGFSTFVESASIANTPFFPISANLANPLVPRQ